MSYLQRPTSVTVVCVILIVFGVFGLYGTYNSYQMVASGEYDRMIKADPRLAAMMKDVPKPSETQILIGGVGIVIQILAGVLMINGMGVGRFVYLGGLVMGFGMALIAGTPIVWMIPGLVIAAIVLFFLFRPAANAYFSGGGEPDYS
jgi:hypothetical protein